MIELQKGIDYDFWGNSRVLEQLNEHPIPEAHQLLSHICTAQNVWLNRISEKPADTSRLFEIRPFNELEIAFKNQHQQFKKCADKLGSRLIVYQNSKGESFSNTLSEILMHVIIHGQHHRAQIAQLLRNAGIAPLPSDYIFYLRLL
ncbi:hypothetical protein EP331_10385 [bacterium]|nr:MAG: hypothetical protein EP331_10385 [bacterium]